MQPLPQAEPGRTFRVCDIAADGVDSLRLKRMGICVDRPLQLVQVGDPMILLVVGTRIGISRRLASQIVVAPWDDPARESPPAITRRTA